MTADAFSRALTITLAHECGWSNHPQDPGGATMRGVTQRVYDAFRDRQGLTRATVRNITRAELETIYRRQYWDAVRGDDLPAGVDLAVFDFAVNSGTARAIRYLQRVLGARQDGHLGEATLAAAAARDAVGLVRALCDARMTFLRGLRTFGTFGRGWTRRVDDIRAKAIQMANGGSVALAPRTPDADEPRAAAAIPPARTTAQTTEGAAAIGVGSLGALSAATEVVKAVREQATTWTEALGSLISPWVIGGALVIVAAVLIWRARKARLAEEVD
jgi:lysozyme family protein